MGTVGPSLVHSCTSELTRQGIWLPYSQSMGDHSSVKRVRVTPGVNRPLAQLNPGFRYLHWPGFISRTHPFGLAAYCVSYWRRGSTSSLLVNSRDPLVIATCEPCSSQRTQAPLLANLCG